MCITSPLLDRRQGKDDFLGWSKLTLRFGVDLSFVS